MDLSDGSTIPPGTVAIAHDEMTWVEWDAALAAHKPEKNYFRGFTYLLPLWISRSGRVYRKLPSCWRGASRSG